LNILYIASQDLQFAEENAQDFYTTFISPLPYEGGRLPIEDIMAWIRYRQDYGQKGGDQDGSLSGIRGGLPLDQDGPCGQRSDPDSLDVGNVEEVDDGQ